MSTDNSSNNKRIAKNTILLYFRMLVTMFVGLFTSRIVLDSLGFSDYGIYNVVGGFVSMFSIVNAGLVAATQRYLTFDLGKGDINALRKTFSIFIVIYLSLCLLVLVVSELCGGWFISEKLTIPEDRLFAAKVVFQLSLFSLILTLLSNPFKALIIAHERMGAFAYIAIYEVCAKLVVAYLLYICSGDRLILYAILLCFISGTLPVLYAVYCKWNFKDEVRIHLYFDWTKIKEIYSFAGWTMLGSFAYMGFTQGLNMLLGMFFTPTVNAARGVAVQIQGVVLRFVTNFQTAVDPQIFKSFARGDIDYTLKLVTTSARFSFFMLFFLSLPLMIESDQFLGFWLKDVPEYASVFLVLILVTSMYDTITNPFAKAVQATGNIKYYSILGSGILILIVPIAYLVLKLGGNPPSVFVVHVIIGGIVLCQRIVMAKTTLCFSYRAILSQLIIPIGKVIIFSIMLPIIFAVLLEPSVIRLLITCSLSVLSTIASVWLFGITPNERIIIKNKIIHYAYNSILKKRS